MRGETRIISVTFQGNAQNFEPGHFTIPKKVADFLEIPSGTTVHLRIADSDGKELFNDDWDMKSGTEIYGLYDAVEAGQLVTVTVSRA